MDGTRLRRDLADSLALPVTHERRLFGGAVLALCGYGLWVGATGAALSFGTDALGRPLSVAPWTGTTTAVFGLAAVLWVVGPAAGATYLLVGALTNVSGNIAHCYRVQYPAVLVGPPLVGFGLAGAAAVGLGTMPDPLLVALVALGAFVLARTLAYSYRVFSLSVPQLVWVFVFLSACVLAVTLLATVASLAGRDAFLADAAVGVGALLGVPGIADVVTGSTQVAGVAVPTLPGLAAGLPVALSVPYVGLQMVAGLFARLRGVTVPRSRLRTGQRYPAFARPTTGATSASGAPASGSDGDDNRDQAEVGGSAGADSTDSAEGTASVAGASGEEGDTGAAGATDEGSVSHTKVFTPPDDADGLDAAVPEGADAATDATGRDGDATRGTSGETGVDASGGFADSETSVASSESGYRCPTCDETFPGGADFAYCPTCGSRLQ